MNILYDYLAFDMQTHGGVSRCFAELYPRLPETVTSRVGVVETDNVYLQQLGFKKVGDTYKEFMAPWDFPGKKLLYKLYYNLYYGDYARYDRWPRHNKAYSIQLLRQQQFDIFHPTFFDDYFLPFLGSKPFVLTLHDMVPELFPQHYAADDVQIIMKRRLLPKAAHIIAVSERTKQDALRLTGISEDKITVIHHGASDEAYQSAAQPLFNFPYILYVGDRNRYKNFGVFSKSCLPLLERYRNMKVVCTGKDFTPDERSFFKANRVEDRFVHQFITTNQMMYNLYHHAVVFVYPSAYEGFGIPILEAYQADCPVMLNEASCFPEVAGDAAIYFHIDGDTTDFVGQFEHFYSGGDSLREQLLQRQRNRLKLFSWQEAARKLARVYQKVQAESR